MKQRMAANRMSRGAARAGATPAETSTPAEGPEMKRETWLPATPAGVRAARSLVREAAAEAGLDGESVWDLMLAATEAFTNAIKHGKPWPNDCILFVTAPCPRGLCVQVCDLGTFDSALEPAPVEATSGRGMQIIAALVDRLELTSRQGRTLVRFEKHRAPLPRQATATSGGRRVRAA
jgi:anti-sigma regulatory factor (Ser/Thr protein kinase)